MAKDNERDRGSRDRDNGKHDRFDKSSHNTERERKIPDTREDRQVTRDELPPTLPTEDTTTSDGG